MISKKGTDLRSYEYSNQISNLLLETILGMLVRPVPLFTLSEGQVAFGLLNLGATCEPHVL